MKVKGTALGARLRYVKERAGDGGYRRLLDALSPATRALVDERILASGWYPFAAFIDLCEVIDRQLGKGDLALCDELGRYGCDANLPTLYKIFFRLADVLYIVHRAAAAWRVNYDQGSMIVIDEGDHVVTMRMQVPTPHRAHCLSVRGWIVRAGELSGAQDVRVTESCRLRGDPHCQFELRWRDK